LRSGFNTILGDLGDSRLNITILEHWRAVVHRQAHLRSPDFYWPQRGVLGYSDSLFLFVLPYLLGRSVGMDPYLAFEVAVILLKAIGFFSMLWLLRDFLEVSRTVAIVGSVLFTLSNLYFISAFHAQLVAVVFVPLLAAFACAGWRSYSGGRRNLGYVCAGSLGLLLALVLFTSFYIGWFTILAAGVAIMCALLLQIVRAHNLSPLSQLTQALRVKGPLCAMAVLGFAVAIVPFLYTYLPTLKETGGRSFQDNLISSSQPIDLVNVGQGNWVWGHTLNAVRLALAHRPMLPAENQRGWPPVTLGLLGAGLLLVFAAPGNRRRASLLSVSFLACWLLSLNVGGRSLWWLVFEFVPGGSAIRAPARLNLVLNVFAVAVVCLVLNELKNRKSRFARASFWALSLFVIVEQINTDPNSAIRRHSEIAIFNHIRPVPSACASFFLTDPLQGERTIDAFNQMDAMLIARLKNLPTLNGYSGWTPPLWDLNTLDPDYLKRVKQWAVAKHVTAGLCQLDLQEGSWTPVDFSTVPYLPGLVIDFHKGGNAPLYQTEGWGTLEPGGSWSLGGRSVLTFNLPKPPDADLLLTFKAHAFGPPQRTSYTETLKINGTVAASWLITGVQIEKHVRVPHPLVPTRLLQIELLNSDPKSPADFRISIDDRKLGLAFEDLRIVPISPENSYLPGSTIDFRWGGNAYIYKAEGWGTDEDGGSWTLGGHSSLLLNLPAPPTADLSLAFTSHAFISPERPSFKETLRVNDHVVEEWNITAARIEKQVRVPRDLVPSSMLRIEFIDQDPKSPAELGISTDDRKLGLALENLNVEPVESNSRRVRE
jgi:hypothetical protein